MIKHDDKYYAVSDVDSLVKKVMHIAGKGHNLGELIMELDDYFTREDVGQPDKGSEFSPTIRHMMKDELERYNAS